MKQKKTLLALGGLCLAALMMLAAWHFTRPEASAGLKHITVEVEHKDDSLNTFTYDTDAEYLGAFLLEQGLIRGSEGAYGLYVETVDDETADYSVDGSWWQLLCNGESASTGADSVVLEDGSTYTWVYTVS